MTPDIGFALWIIRASHRLTQRQVAKRSGATRQQITDWENGTKLPTVENFLRICQGLEVSPSAFLQIAEARSSGLVLVKKPVQRVGADWKRAA